MKNKKELNEIPDNELEKVAGGDMSSRLNVPTLDNTSRHQKRLDEVMNEELARINSGVELVLRKTPEERQISDKIKKLVSDIQGDKNVKIY